jgi:hypothetical protein
MDAAFSGSGGHNASGWREGPEYHQAQFPCVRRQAHNRELSQTLRLSL